MYRVSRGLVLFSFFLLFVYSKPKTVDGKCDLISTKSIRNKVSRDLYGIEVGLKLLMVEGEEEEAAVHAKEKLHQVHSIMHNFLASKYSEAERRLENLIQHLSWQPPTNLTGFNYIPEATIDFSTRALIQAKRAQSMIHEISLCRWNNNITTGYHDEHHHPSSSSSSSSSSRSSKDEEPSCLVDGTKCQYSSCAQGKKLPRCAIGFAGRVTGGAKGTYYMVNRSDDDPKYPAPGTLRFGVNLAGRSKGGAWITFKESMVIKLKDKLWVHSNTTIDGRGVKVTITAKVLALKKVQNVILHNFEVVSTGYSDTIHVFDGSHLVWLDHLTCRDASLGLITVLQGSTDVTISNCYLSNPDYNTLLGASDQDTIDQILRVTVYRNWFDSSTQRMPHCRWGFCHVANNYYRDWYYYAIGGRVHAKVLSERNVFEPGRRKEVTPWHTELSDITPTIESSKDLLLKGATFHQFLVFGTLSNPRDEFPSYKLPVRQTNSLMNLVINCSGVLFGSKLNHCLATP